MEIPKSSISFRCSVELKDQLNREAGTLGIKRSELCEQRIAISCSLDSSAEELREKNRQLSEMVNQLSSELKDLSSLKSIIQTPHFMKLFDRVKGSSDTITIEGQAQAITYNTPYDLLKALTYSFNLKP